MVQRGFPYFEIGISVAKLKIPYSVFKSVINMEEYGGYTGLITAVLKGGRP